MQVLGRSAPLTSHSESCASSLFLQDKLQGLKLAWDQGSRRRDNVTFSTLKPQGMVSLKEIKSCLVGKGKKKIEKELNVFFSLFLMGNRGDPCAPSYLSERVWLYPAVFWTDILHSIFMVPVYLDLWNSSISFMINSANIPIFFSLARLCCYLPTYSTVRRSSGALTTSPGPSHQGNIFESEFLRYECIFEWFSWACKTVQHTMSLAA